MMKAARTVQVRGYTRTVSPITVEFICQQCQRPQIYTMFPGPRPKWCSACYPEVRKQQVDAHVRAGAQGRGQRKERRGRYAIRREVLHPGNSHPEQARDHLDDHQHQHRDHQQRGENATGAVAEIETTAEHGPA